MLIQCILKAKIKLTRAALNHEIAMTIQQECPLNHPSTLTLSKDLDILLDLFVKYINNQHS